MIHVLHRYPETYVDSVVQLSGTRALYGVEGVDWASAAMATPGNVAVLETEGFEPGEPGANDLVIAVRAASREIAEGARAAGEKVLFAERERAEQGRRERAARTLEEAVARRPGSCVAVVSVPGDLAALEAHKALSAGLHVLLFSDNVPVDDEIALKDRAAGLGLLLMGPGAGTAMLGGACLGFANVVRPGRVAVVAAAGTGAQEAATLLDRWGVGVAHVIGLGGRDLGARVGGRMALAAVRALAADDGIDGILLVSKPPDVDVARRVLAAAGSTPLVASLIGFPGGEGAAVRTPERSLRSEHRTPERSLRSEHRTPERSLRSEHQTLEAGAVAMARAMGAVVPDVAAGLARAVGAAIADLPERRTLVRGLFSGGTLCYESLVVLADVLGEVWSNTPLRAELRVPAPGPAHVCLDLGEEEYTKGRPHPMIDPAARIELLRAQSADPDVATIVLDVVLGHGAHADPAAELAPECARVVAGGGPRVVVYVLGTDADPQGLARQRRAFAEAGCLVTETAARASLAAAAIARREPGLAERSL